jgi:hypothetical protein
VRPGYTVESLRRTLEPWFSIDRVKTYSGSFTETIDTAIRFAVDRIKGHKTDGEGPHKGNIVTQQDVEKSGGGFGVLALTYPLVWVFSRLDYLLFLQSGYKLIVRARPTGAPVAREDHE